MRGMSKEHPERLSVCGRDMLIVFVPLILDPLVLVCLNRIASCHFGWLECGFDFQVQLNVLVHLYLLRGISLESCQPTFMDEHGMLACDCGCCLYFALRCMWLYLALRCMWCICLAGQHLLAASLLRLEHSCMIIWHAAACLHNVWCLWSSQRSSSWAARSV